MSKEDIKKDIVEDFLEVDQNIPGQNFVCMSFVSPEKFLKQKEVFFNAKFLEYLFSSDEMLANDLRTKLLSKDIDTSYDSIFKIYEDWKYTRKDVLESDFFEKNDYKTSIRGLKIRGTYDTHKEASVRAQVVRKRDPSFNVFSGQVGYWLPWDPECDSIPEQEYQEGMLNDLVKKYKENLDSKETFYEQVKNEKIEKAKKEITAKKEVLKAQTEMKVTEPTAEDLKNIETVRNIVDESSKLYYDSLKPKTDDDSKATQSLDEPDNESISEAPNAQNPQSTNPMAGLEDDDPWVARKKTD